MQIGAFPLASEEYLSTMADSSQEDISSASISERQCRSLMQEKATSPVLESHFSLPQIPMEVSKAVSLRDSTSSPIRVRFPKRRRAPLQPGGSVDTDGGTETSGLGDIQKYGGSCRSLATDGSGASPDMGRRWRGDGQTVESLEELPYEAEEFQQLILPITEEEKSSETSSNTIQGEAEQRSPREDTAVISAHGDVPALMFEAPETGEPYFGLYDEEGNLIDPEASYQYEKYEARQTELTEARLEEEEPFELVEQVGDQVYPEGVERFYEDLPGLDFRNLPAEEELIGAEAWENVYQEGQEAQWGQYQQETVVTLPIEDGVLQLPADPYTALQALEELRESGLYPNEQLVEAENYYIQLLADFGDEHQDDLEPLTVLPQETAHPPLSEVVLEAENLACEVEELEQPDEAVSGIQTVVADAPGRESTQGSDEFFSAESKGSGTGGEFYSSAEERKRREESAISTDETLRDVESILTEEESFRSAEEFDEARSIVSAAETKTSEEQAFYSAGSGELEQKGSTPHESAEEETFQTASEEKPGKSPSTGETFATAEGSPLGEVEEKEPVRQPYEIQRSASGVDLITTPQDE